MIKVKKKVHFRVAARGRRRIVTDEPSESTIANKGRIPRVSRLMALAIKLDGMLRSGEVSDATELAVLSHISQPRMSQILSLTLLAPDIQEQLLFLPRAAAGRCPIHEKMLRRLTAEIDWRKQRWMWAQLLSPA